MDERDYKSLNKEAMINTEETNKISAEEYLQFIELKRRHYFHCRCSCNPLSFEDYIKKIIKN